MSTRVGTLRALLDNSTFITELTQLNRFANQYSQHAVGILLPELNVHALNERVPIWLVQMSRDHSYQLTRIPLRELMNKIQHHSGGP